MHPTRLRLLLIALTLSLGCPSTSAHAESMASAPAPSPDKTAPTPREPSSVMAATVWTLTQLIPSPMLVIRSGDSHLGFGMRWQVTPLLFSFGIAERPFRTFYISPIARHSASIEAYAAPEWVCCAADGGSSWQLRGGARLYLPLLEHGEKLSWSLGGSIQHGLRARAGAGWAVDVGLYTLFGVLGLHVTVAPFLEHREVMVALNIRYF